MRLPRDFYTIDAYNLGQKLLGKDLCIKRDEKILRFRIVETEAYGGAYDRACHAYNFKYTNRTKSLYLIGGCLYIYLIYGMYYMLNITANKENVPEAVLIRAVEPLNNDLVKTNGPGKLCKTLMIDKTLNEIDLTTSDIIYIEDSGYIPKEIVYTKRINIDYAKDDKDRLWRFYIKDNKYVSKK